MIRLNFENHTKVNVGKAIFANALKNACATRELKRKIENREGEGSITLTLVRDAEIQNLNAAYRQKNTPTDVLSFRYGNIPVIARSRRRRSNLLIAKRATPSSPPELIGEIVISTDTAGSQAEARGHALKTELKKLFIHGFLHILGYGHETDEEEAKMERLAVKILQGTARGAQGTARSAA